MALLNDPEYQGALYDKAAGQEFAEQGRAYLLPNVGMSFNTSQNDVDRTQNGVPVDPKKFASRVTTLSLRQPLFNLDAWERYKGGRAQTNYSEAMFTGNAQDLIIRLITVYLDVLLAEDQLQLAVAQRDAYAENQQANERMFKLGAGTRTDVLETMARYELSRAMVVEAQDNVETRRNKLAVIIGGPAGALDMLLSGIPDLTLSPATLSDWEGLARAANAGVLAQRHSVDYAQTEVARNKAGHAPRMDLVVSHSRNTADSLFTFNQESTVNSVGVQVSLPLYSGGSVNSQTRQAAARLGSARAELDSKLQQALVEVRKQFQLVSSSRLRLAAMEQAEQSARDAIDATRKSVAGGQRVNLDVLNAMQQLYTTRRDLSEAKHGYLLAYMRLHAAAGVLAADDLIKIGAYFQPRR